MNEKQMDRLDSEAREQRAASELAPCELQAQSARCSVAVGSAPWAWTHNREMEYWHPAGKSRDEAIAAGKRHGRKTFWIAQTRRMTEDEKEEYDGSWIVDPSTEERISPNGCDELRPERSEGR